MNLLPHARHGFGTVRPYLYGYPELPDMLEHAFGAEILERLTAGSGAHVELRLGDSALVVEAADPPHAGGRPASIYVYLADVDGAYERAVACGAAPTAPPEEKPYDERAAAVTDRYGNIWYLSTYRGRSATAAGES